MTCAYTHPPLSARDAVAGHLVCTRCHYDLFGSIAGRCPECGADFDLLGLFIRTHFFQPSSLRERLKRGLHGLARRLQSV